MVEVDAFGLLNRNWQRIVALTVIALMLLFPKLGPWLFRRIVDKKEAEMRKVMRPIFEQMTKSAPLPARSTAPRHH
jgi:hypothetical protein